MNRTSNPGVGQGPPRGSKGKPRPLDDLESARVVVAAARSGTPPDRAVSDSLPPEWRGAAAVAHGAGEGGLDDWLKAEKTRLKPTPERYEAIKAALLWALAEPPDDAKILPIQPAQERPRRYRLIRARELAEAVCEETWLVEGVLVADQPCVVAAPKKTLKTSVMADLAFALAVGDRWLGRFRAPEPTTVLFMSGESGRKTLHRTMRRVAEARGRDVADAGDRLILSEDLPKLGDPADVEELRDLIREEGVRVVIVDPLYLCLLSGAAGKHLDPANLFDVGPLLLQVARACLDAGATPVLVHHFRKGNGNHYEMPELESIAYAGCQEFARQWILLSRRRRFEPNVGRHELWLSVGGSAGHSGEYAVDVEEGVMDADFGGRRWEVSVRYASEANRDAAQEPSVSKAEKMLAAKAAGDSAKEKAIETDAVKAFAKLQNIGPATKSKLREHLGWNGDKIGAALARLVETGRIEDRRFSINNSTGSREVNGYQVTAIASNHDPD